MVLGTETHIYTGVSIILVFQLTTQKDQLLKGLNTDPISNRWICGYPFCLKTQDFGAFDEVSKISSPSAKSWVKLPT